MRRCRKRQKCLCQPRRSLQAQDGRFDPGMASVFGQPKRYPPGQEVSACGCHVNRPGFYSCDRLNDEKRQHIPDSVLVPTVIGRVSTLQGICSQPLQGQKGKQRFSVWTLRSATASDWLKIGLPEAAGGDVITSQLPASERRTLWCYHLWAPHGCSFQ